MPPAPPCPFFLLEPSTREELGETDGEPGGCPAPRQRSVALGFIPGSGLPLQVLGSGAPSSVGAGALGAEGCFLHTRLPSSSASPGPRPPAPHSFLSPQTRPWSGPSSPFTHTPVYSVTLCRMLSGCSRPPPRGPALLLCSPPLSEPALRKEADAPVHTEQLAACSLSQEY